MEERYKMRDVQNTLLSCSNKRFRDSFKSQNIAFGGEGTDGGVLIMCARLYLHFFFLPRCPRVSA